LISYVIFWATSSISSAHLRLLLLLQAWQLHASSLQTSRVVHRQHGRLSTHCWLDALFAGFVCAPDHVCWKSRCNMARPF
jgi:hypothetical protein